MINVHVVVYICKAITPIGLPGYNDIALGFPGSDRSSIIIRGTCSRFTLGKEYLITIGEYNRNIGI
jgi:hypothetical protein